MSSRNYFQRLLDNLQKLISLATGCRYHWRVKLVYSVERDDLFFTEVTISLNSRSLIESRREIVKAVPAMHDQVKGHWRRNNGEVRVIPLAYLGWF
ncbi:hypothetical protein [Microbulbifer sp. PSTR4-B]|uniref:hypothetical protein n=1 Tax=unclassified Microbulbifer TaxID=2619833 RepID=UPI00403A9460